MGIDLAKAFLQRGPVYGPGKEHQFVLRVENLIETGAEQVLLSRLAPFVWLAHRRALRFTAVLTVNHASPDRKTTN